MNVEVQPIELDGNALARAYVSGDGEARRFYAGGPPDTIASYRDAADRVRAFHPDARWEEIGQALAAMGSEPPERLDEWVRDRGLLVVTGQQAGLFTGPLYTLYKAMTAVRTAERLEALLEAPVLAWFTVASEDHDWEEINHTHAVDLDNQLITLRAGRGPATPEVDQPPIHRIRLGDDVEAALDELARSTPDSEFEADVLGPLREAYRPGRGWAEAFESALRQLMRGHRIAIVQGNHPVGVRGRREVLERDWTHRADVEALLRSRGDALEAAGWPLQVSITENATNLFVEGAAGRDRLVWEGDAGRLRRSGTELSGDAVRRTIRDEPERVSPGVLLRPVAEAAALPVIAHVVGPGEIAYLAQNQVLFELHDVPAPVVVPRAAFRLVEARVGKVLEKYGVDPEAFQPDPGRAIEELLKDQTPAGLRDALRELRAAVGRALDRVESAALDFDRGARSAVGAGKASVFRGIDDLESRLEGRVKEANEVMRQQLEKAAVNLAPNGAPQERMLNVYPFLVRYGDPLLDAVYDGVVAPVD